MKKYLGVDIGGTSVKIGCIGLDGTIGQSREYAVDFDQYETPILTTVIKSIQIFLLEIGCKIGEFEGIGVSATGQINTKTGIVIGAAGHIKNWQGSHIKEEMEECFKIPVSVVNDANCAVIAEQWNGVGKNERNIVMLTIGTGIGGGIIVNNELLLGEGGLAGEIGHITINANGEICPCGNVGCYEREASMCALVRKVEKLGIIKDNPVNGRTIFEQIMKGDIELKNIVEKWIEVIAAGIVSLVHTFNPRLVIIGGGVSKQEELFIEPLRGKVCRSIMPAYRDNLLIRAAKYGNEAGMLGAVSYLLKNKNLECTFRDIDRDN